MANHVHSVIKIKPSNNEGIAKLKEIVSRLPDNNSTPNFGELFTIEKDDSPSIENIEDYIWSEQNVGPKWCYIDEFEYYNGELKMVCVSAWIPPEIGLTNLLKEVSEVDPKVVTTIMYDDEMPNFWGAYVYQGSEMIDGREDGEEDIAHFFNQDYPEIAKYWNSAEQDWYVDENGNITSDAYKAKEEYEEEIWGWITDKQLETINDIVSELD